MSKTAPHPMARPAVHHAGRPTASPVAHPGLISILPGSSLVDALERAAAAPGQSWFIRLVREDGSFKDMDRREFLELALRVAGWCRANGLEPGGRAIICLENAPEWGAVYFGVLLAGGVAVPVDAQTVPADAAHYLAASRASIVLVHRAGIFPDTLPDGGVLSIGAGQSLAHAPLDPATVHRPGPDDVAALLFTSGTTGNPKAVMLTHANLLANVDAIRLTGLLAPQDNFLAVLPLHHAYPCMVNLLVPALAGARATFVEAARPEAILGALKAAGVTILVLTPQYVGVFYRRILKRFQDLPLGAGRLLLRLLAATAGRQPDLLAPLRRAVRRGVGPSFRFFLTGGARCEPELIAGMAALGIGVIEGYGLSETAPVVSFNRPDEAAPGSVGRPVHGVEVRVDAPDGEGYGELMVRGPNVMPGYFENPEATAKALRGGWFATGDQGRLDEAGRIFIRGRGRDIIVLPSGKKVLAEEVEAHYRQAPSVAELCVLQGPDGSLAAVVVPDQEFFRKTDSPDVRHNVRWDLEVLSRELPPYKRIGQFTMVSGELPKTRLGKVKRHLAEQLFAAEKAAGGAQGQWPDLDEAGRRAVEAMRTVSGMDAPAPGSHLELDLGIDSLKRLELMTLLEDFLGRSVPEERFQRLATAGEVVALATELATEIDGALAEKSGRHPGPDATEFGGGEGPASPSGRASPAARQSSDTGGLAGFTAAGRELSPELSGKVRLEQGLAGTIATHALWCLVRGAAGLGFGLTVKGADNIPDGPAIIAPNHESFLDGFMVFAAAPRRVRTRLYFLGLARFFDAPLVRPLASLFRLIPVDAGRMSETMRLSAHVLSNGKLLCVFPEGARSPSGELQEFRKGPVTLSRELGVPVVPVGISGTYEAWPVGGRLRPAKVAVTFGQPIMPESPEELRDAVAALLSAGRRA